MLCKQFGLDPLKDGVILSHKEGCARGIASNHGDPEHLWNQLGTGYTMNGFRAAVKAAMGAEVTTPGTPEKPTTAPENEKEGEEMRYNKISEMPSYAQPTIIKMVDGGFIGGCGTGAKDENNRPADLDLSMDMIRVFVTNDRAGLYDKT